MDITGLFTDENAVSPVIGVILIVAITVILSAIVGSFALGLGESQDTAPQSSWKADYTSGSSDTLELTHESGDPMEADRLYVVVSGASSGGSPNGRTAVDTLVGESEVSSGSTVAVNDTSFGSNLDLSGATVRLVWEDEDTDDQADSATLLKWEGPDA
jgi:flagellin-like protein